MKHHVFRAGGAAASRSFKSTQGTDSARNRLPPLRDVRSDAAKQLDKDRADAVTTRLQAWRSKKTNKVAPKQAPGVNAMKSWKSVKKTMRLTETDHAKKVFKQMTWPKYIIHPASPWKVSWDCLVCLVIVFTCVVIPYRLCFDVPNDVTWLTLDIIADSIFAVDIVLNFLTAYEIAQSTTKTVYERDIKKIVDHYIYSRWFFIDVVSTVPFDYIIEGVLLTSKNKGLKSLRTFRIVRLTRLLKISRSFKLGRAIAKFEDQQLIHPAYLRLIRLLLKVLTLGHILGCFWYYFALINAEEDNWISSYGLDPNGADYWTKYTSSLYWAIATLTGVGYGDISARTTSERIIAIIASIGGSTVFGFIIGNIATIMEAVDARGTQYRRRMADVKNYMMDRKIPWMLQRRVIRYYEYFYEWKSVFDEEDILSNLSTGLKHRLVRLQANVLLVGSNFFIAHCKRDMNLASLLYKRLKPLQAIMGETLSLQNDIGRELFFLIRGTVASLWTMPKLVWDDINRDGDMEEDDMTIVAKKTLEKAQFQHQNHVLSGFEKIFSRGVKISKAAKVEDASSRKIKPERGATFFQKSPTGTPRSSVKKSPTTRLKGITRQISKVFSGKRALPTKLGEKLRLTSVHRSGEHFGIMSIFLGRPQPAQYSALSSCTLFTIRIDDLLEILDEGYEKIENELMEEAENRFSLFSKTVVQYVKNLMFKDHIMNRSKPRVEYCMIQRSVSNANDKFEEKENILVTKDKVMGACEGILLYDEILHIKYLEKKHKDSYEDDGQSLGTQDGGILKKIFFPGPKMVRKFVSSVPRYAFEAKKKSVQPEKLMPERSESFDHLADGSTKGSDNVLVEEDDSDLYKRWIFHPTCKFKMAWDSYIILFIMYSVISVPFFTCFAIRLSTGFIVFHYFIDAMFFVDVIISFRTGYIDRNTGVVHTSPTKIAKKYLKSWFTVDFVSCLPVDWLVDQYQGTGSGFRTLKLFRVLRLVRLVKLARLMRLARFITVLEDLAEVPPALIRLIKLMLQVILVGHILACLFYFISQNENSVRSDNSWWADADLPLPEQVSVDSEAAFHVYIAAMYWTLATMTTCGYGDIVAKSNDERLWSVLTMLIGATVFGYIVGSMATLVDHLDIVTVRYKEKMETVNNYLRESAIPPDLQKSVRLYYERYLYRKSAFDERMLLGNLSEKLRREVVMFLNADIIQKIPIFKGITDKLFIANLVSIMSPSVCSSGDMIIKEGTYGQQMYFLVKGCVEITGGTGANGQKLNQYIVLKEGAFFGELSLLLNTKRAASISALTKCSMFVLTKRNLDEIMLFYPQLKVVLKNHVVALVSSLNERGVMLHDTKSNDELLQDLLNDTSFQGNDSPDSHGNSKSNQHGENGANEAVNDEDEANEVVEAEITESGREILQNRPKKRKSAVKTLKKDGNSSPVSRFLKKRISMAPKPTDKLVTDF